MKILVNATVTRMGGAVQKAVELVRASTSQPQGHRFFYALSATVAENLRGVAEVDPASVMVASSPPSHPLHGAKTRRALREIEERFSPDVVFTVFGPAHMTFRSPHLMGFAVPWITHPNPYAWGTLRNPLERARFWAWCRYITLWTRFADRWVLETEVAADGLASVLGRPRDLFHVIPNVPGGAYDKVVRSPAEFYLGTEKRHASDVNVLVFSHWYPHKNLGIVPSVALAARRRDASRRYRFLLTFDRSHPAWGRIEREARGLGVAENVINLGPVRVGDGPWLYGSVDVVFLPTLLETFTATYPEAMACRKPIVTTNLPFARDLCGEAALFTTPNDPIDAADKIAAVTGDELLRAALVGRGVERLARSRTRQESYEMLLDVLRQTHELGTAPRTNVPVSSRAL